MYVCRLLTRIKRATENKIMKFANE